MALMTASGFCVVAALSRYTRGLPPITLRFRMGKSLRIFTTLRASFCIITLIDLDVNCVVLYFNLVSFKGGGCRRVLRNAVCQFKGGKMQGAGHRLFALVHKASSQVGIGVGAYPVGGIDVASHLCYHQFSVSMVKLDQLAA